MIPHPTGAPALIHLTQDLLSEQVGTDFEVRELPPGPFPLTLTKLVEHTRNERNEAFSIFFRGPLNRFIPQGIYQLKHGQIGEFGIFLVPVAQTADGFEYEAVFNHIIQS
jgi:hypothetical protein